ncbi:hypothetical protein HK098_002744 [Nowakowskiella sp. JEL0407]|nr:hypothetical protein HK098_002744 [Nowakowskiella sp. JEL0407]
MTQRRPRRPADITSDDENNAYPTISATRSPHDIFNTSPHLRRNIQNSPSFSRSPSISPSRSRKVSSQNNCCACRDVILPDCKADHSSWTATNKSKLNSESPRQLLPSVTENEYDIGRSEETNWPNYEDENEDENEDEFVHSMEEPKFNSGGLTFSELHHSSTPPMNRGRASLTRSGGARRELRNSLTPMLISYDESDGSEKSVDLGDDHDQDGGNRKRRNSGSPVMGLKKREKILDDLQKENFGLKLRIYHLEEQAEKLAPEWYNKVLNENLELKAKIENSANEIRRYENEFELIGDQAEEISNENEALREEVSNLKQELRNLRSELSKRGPDADILKSELDQTRAELQTQRRKLQEANQQLESLQIANYRQEKEVSQANEKADEFKNLYNQELKKNEKLEEELNELRESETNQNSKIEFQSENISAIYESNGELRNENAILNDQLRKCQDNVRRLEKELYSAKSSLKILLDLLASKLGRNIEISTERITEKDSTVYLVNSVKEYIHVLSKDFTSVQTELVVSQEYLRTSNEELAAMREEVESLRNNLYRNQSNDRNLNSQKSVEEIETADKLSRELASAKKIIENLQKELDSQRKNSSNYQTTETQTIERLSNELNAANELIEGMRQYANDKSDGASDDSSQSKLIEELKSAHQFIDHLKKVAEDRLSTSKYYLQQIENLKADLTSAQQSINQLQRQVKRSSPSNSQDSTAIERLELELRSSQLTIERYRQELESGQLALQQIFGISDDEDDGDSSFSESKLSRQLLKLNSKIAAKLEEASNIADELKRLKQNSSARGSTASSAPQQSSLASADITIDQSYVAGTSLNSASVDPSELRHYKKYQNAKTIIKRLEEQLRNNNTRISELEEANKRLKSEIDRLNTNRTDLLKHLSLSEQERNSLHSIVSQLEEKESLQQENFRNLSASDQEKLDEISKLNTQLLEAKRIVLQEKNRYDLEIAGLNDELEKVHTENDELRNELYSLNDQLQQIRNTATTELDKLRKKMMEQTQLFKSASQQAESHIEALEGELQNRLDVIHGLEKELQSEKDSAVYLRDELETKSRLCTDLEDQLKQEEKLRLAEAQEKSVSLDVLGKAHEEERAHLMKRAAEAERRCDLVERELGFSRENLAKLREEVNRSYENLNATDKERRTLEESLKKEKAQIVVQYSRTIVELEEKLESTHSFNSRLHEEVKSKSAEIVRLQKELELKEDQIDGMDLEITNIRSKLEKAISERDNLKAELSKSMDHLAEIDEKRGTSEQRHSELINKLKSDINALRLSLEEKENECGELNKSLEKWKRQNERLSEQLKSIQFDTIQTADKYRALQKDYDQQATQLSESKQSVNDLKKSLQTKEEELRKVFSAEGERQSAYGSRMKEVKIQIFSAWNKQQYFYLQIYEAQLNSTKQTLLTTIMEHVEVALGEKLRDLKLFNKLSEGDNSESSSNITQEQVLAKVRQLSQIRVSFTNLVSKMETRFEEAQRQWETRFTAQHARLAKFDTITRNAAARLKALAEENARLKPKLRKSEGENQALSNDLRTTTSNLRTIEKELQEAEIQVRQLQSMVEKYKEAAASSGVGDRQQQRGGVPEATTTTTTTTYVLSDSARIKELERLLMNAEEKLRLERLGAEERVAELLDMNRGLMHELEILRRKCILLEERLKVQVQFANSPQEDIRSKRIIEQLGADLTYSNEQFEACKQLNDNLLEEIRYLKQSAQHKNEGVAQALRDLQQLSNRGQINILKDQIQSKTPIKRNDNFLNLSTSPTEKNLRKNIQFDLPPSQSASVPGNTTIDITSEIIDRYQQQHFGDEGDENMVPILTAPPIPQRRRV